MAASGSTFPIGPWITAELAQRFSGLPDDLKPPHGLTFEEVLRRYGADSRWLQALVLAGHVPDSEGAIMALEAFHEWILQFFDAILAKDGAACAVADAMQMANAWRFLAERIDSWIAACETTALELYDAHVEEVKASEIPLSVSERAQRTRERLETSTARREQLSTERADWSSPYDQ